MVMTTSVVHQECTSSGMIKWQIKIEYGKYTPESLTVQNMHRYDDRERMFVSLRVILCWI